MNNILEKHVPFNKIIKYKLKFKTDTWIHTVLQKSVSNKDKIFKNYIKKRLI